MTKKQIEDEAIKQDLIRQGKILIDGISDEALQLIEQLGHYSQPIFQFRDQELKPIAGDAHTIALMAAVRDGERGLVQQIHELRRYAEKHSNPNNTDNGRRNKH